MQVNQYVSEYNHINLISQLDVVWNNDHLFTLHIFNNLNQNFV